MPILKANKSATIIVSAVITIVIIVLAFFRNNFWQKFSSDNRAQSQNAVASATDTTVSLADTTALDYSVCLDPGHGGSDIGATYSGINESDINLEVAKYLRDILLEKGYAVYSTRDSDTFIAKRDRSEYCNGQKANIMLSIHHNSYESDSSVDYATALYYKDIDQKLAANILSAISSSLSVQNEGIAKFNNSLLWTAEMPATLSESFFLSNKEEIASIMQNDSRLKLEARAIACGIENYFNEFNTASPFANSNSLFIDRRD